MTADWPTGPQHAADEADQTQVQPSGWGTEVRVEPSPAPSSDVDTSLGLPTWALIPIAALTWWVVGFLAWLLDGLHLGDEMTRSALPMVGPNVSGMVLGGGLGGLCAALVGLLGAGRRWARAGAIVIGVAVAVALTLVQSFAALRNTSPSNFSTADRVLFGLTGVVIVATVVGVGWGLLALTGRVGCGMALAGLAGGAGVWMSSVLSVAGQERPGDLVHGGEVARWLGAAILAGALVRIGIHPLSRLVWWPVAVLLAWVIGPTITASGYLQGLLRPGTDVSNTFDELISPAMQVWRASASPDVRPLTPWILAILVAAVAASVIGLMRKTRETDEPTRREESVL